MLLASEPAFADCGVCGYGYVTLPADGSRDGAVDGRLYECRGGAFGLRSGNEISGLSGDVSFPVCMVLGLRFRNPICLIGRGGRERGVLSGGTTGQSEIHVILSEGSSCSSKSWAIEGS